MTIPECTYPLSKHWDQPKNTDIEIDDNHAMMSQESFGILKAYSFSVPTDIYPGKLWKAWDIISKVWYLRWYLSSACPSECMWDQRIIILI